jgi:RNA polymerase sigma factor (sigma-70 family)
LKELNENFITIIEKNKGIIHKVANSYCMDEEDRKDLVQEIIIQLWQSFGKYDPQYSLSTWMYRIALNVAISFYRKDTRRKDISVPLSEDIMLFVKDNEPDETETNIGLLQQFLADLKELDRALMILYLEEKSHKEMAEIVGLSTTNIATKIGRIKEKLKIKFATIKN